MNPYGKDKISDQNLNGRGASSTSLGKTSCLLCYHPVSINLNRKSSPVEAEARRKMVKALCEYQKLTFAIPDYCSELKYPFCVDCKRQLEGMSREWEALKVTFAGIERQVADGELKRFRRVNSGMLSELEKEKAVLLRDMLLEGYRVKLLKSQRRPHPAVSNMVVGSDASCSSSSSSLIPEQSASLTSDSSWIEMEMDESDEAEESVDILVWDDEQPTLGDSETSLTISNIRTVANKKEEVGLLQVKKEMIAEKGTENRSVSMTTKFPLAPGPDDDDENSTSRPKHLRVAPEKVKVQRSRKSFEHDCDICGRKIKGPLCNLKKHKFLHKNDAERQAAVDAGERGLEGGSRSTSATLVQDIRPRIRLQGACKYHAVERASSMDASKFTAAHPSVRRSAVEYKVANKNKSTQF
ncbi:hypothetical protein Ocin01_20006 [Orchesella cincta]|uniref:Uncharacterized protein n=1 Tax=Orchesella cincta TaxID=48709 RepID=A0A1D2M136_ORCCI|nr:hypothetical protein Ocin01_20006 [Orchesella cincta]